MTPTKAKTATEIKQAVLAALNLADELMADGVALTREGSNLVACCPFHSEDTASFKLKEGEQWYKCFGCGAKGDVLTWLGHRMGRTLEGTDFIEVLREGCRRARIEWTEAGAAPAAHSRPAARFCEPKPAALAVKEKQRTVYATKAKLKSAVEYFAGNKKGTLAHIHTYRDADGNPVLGVFRVHVPHVGADGVSGRKKFFLQATACPGGWHLTNSLELNPLYNLDTIKDVPSLILVEGELKADAFVALGISATCNAGGANAVNRTDWTPLAGKTVAIWRDNDEPGEKWQSAIEEKLAALRPRCSVRIVRVEQLDLEPGDDVIDYLKLFGEAEKIEALRVVLDGAASGGLVGELYAEFQQAIAGKRFWVPFCWPRISSAIKAMRPGGAVILAGSPGAAKSFVTIQNIDKWQQMGLEPLAMMMEDGAAYHLNRSVVQQSGVTGGNDYEWIKNNPDDAIAMLDANREFLDRMSHCLTAPPFKAKPDVDWMLKWLEGAAKEGHRVLIIDPITAMYRGRNVQEEDFRFVMGAKSIMQEHGCSLFLTTHIRKSTGGKPGPITMDDLSGGQEYSKFTQVVLYLQAHDFREGPITSSLGTIEGKYNRTIQVMKARDSWGQGKRFAFLWKDMRLEELGELA